MYRDKFEKRVIKINSDRFEICKKLENSPRVLLKLDSSIAEKLTMSQQVTMNIIIHNIDTLFFSIDPLFSFYTLFEEKEGKVKFCVRETVEKILEIYLRRDFILDYYTECNTEEEYLKKEDARFSYSIKVNPKMDFIKVSYPFNEIHNI